MMDKKRSRRRLNKYFRVFFIGVIIISVLIVIANFLVYSYYLRIYNAAKSINARASNTASVSLIVESADLIYPAVSIIYPTSTTYTSHVTRLDYSASDTNLQSCWYSLNSGATNTSMACGDNITGITSAEGSNTWKVYANDSSGNINSSSVTFTVSIPTAVVITPGGGGGGGGAAISKTVKDFDVSPAELNIFIAPGKQTEKEIIVRNKGTANLIIDISASGIANMISLDTNRLILGTGEEKKILLTVGHSEYGVYAGKIIFRSGILEKEVFVLINVISEKKLFDVSVSIPESEKVIAPGENINSFISLTQVGEPFQADVNIKYVIKDFEGNTLFSESETMAVFQAKSFVKEFITSELSQGDYIIGIEITYPGGFASSSAHFKIYKKGVDFKLIALFVIIIFLIAVIIYSIFKYKKSRKYLNAGNININGRHKN